MAAGGTAFLGLGVALGTSFGWLIERAGSVVTAGSPVTAGGGVLARSTLGGKLTSGEWVFARASVGGKRRLVTLAAGVINLAATAVAPRKASTTLAAANQRYLRLEPLKRECRER